MQVILQSALRIGFPEQSVLWISQCYNRSKEAVVQVLGAIYSRTKEVIRRKISGNHIDLIQQGNCLTQSLVLQPTLAITRFDIRRNRSTEIFRLKSNLFRDRQILCFYQSKKIFRIENSLILSYSLSLTLGFSGRQIVHRQVMTTSRLHFALDKIALTCCIHSLKDIHTLQSDIIRSSCTQSLGMDFSLTTPREAFAHSARRVHTRTVKRMRARARRAGYVVNIQGGNMIINYMSIRNRIPSNQFETTPKWVFNLCNTSLATYLVIRSAEFRIPSIIEIRSKSIGARFCIYRNLSSTFFVFSFQYRNGLPLTCRQLNQCG